MGWSVVFRFAGGGEESRGVVGNAFMLARAGGQRKGGCAGRGMWLTTGKGINWERGNLEAAAGTIMRAKGALRSTPDHLANILLLPLGITQPCTDFPAFPSNTNCLSVQFFSRAVQHTHCARMLRCLLKPIKKTMHATPVTTQLQSGHKPKPAHHGRGRQPSGHQHQIGNPTPARPHRCCRMCGCAP